MENYGFSGEMLIESLSMAEVQRILSVDDINYCLYLCLTPSISVYFYQVINSPHYFWSEEIVAGGHFVLFNEDGFVPDAVPTSVGVDFGVPSLAGAATLARIQPNSGAEI